MVRIYCFFTIFQLFQSPVFQLNCYFLGYRAIRYIAAQRQIFAPPPTPLDRVFQLKATLQKEMVRKCYEVSNLHCFSRTIFINYNTTIPMVDKLVVNALRECAHVLK